MHAFLAEHRSAVFPDELFADLFPTNRGPPSVPADVIATVKQPPTLAPAGGAVVVGKAEV